MSGFFAVRPAGATCSLMILTCCSRKLGSSERLQGVPRGGLLLYVPWNSPSDVTLKPLDRYGRKTARRQHQALRAAICRNIRHGMQTRSIGKRHPPCHFLLGVVVLMFSNQACLEGSPCAVPGSK